MSKKDETKLRAYNGKYIKTLRLPCTPAMKEFITAQNNISKSLYYLIVDYLRRHNGKASDVCIAFQSDYEYQLIHAGVNPEMYDGDWESNRQEPEREQAKPAPRPMPAMPKQQLVPQVPHLEAEAAEECDIPDCYL